MIETIQQLAYSTFYVCVWLAIAAGFMGAFR
jgi:hypothetical protein